MPANRLFLFALLLCPLSLPALTPAQSPSPRPKLDKAGDPLPAGAGIRIGTTRFRHAGLVFVIGYSRDGGTLITQGDDNTLHFWDARNGTEIFKLEQKSANVRFTGRLMSTCLLSGDGSTLALGMDDGLCTMVDVATRKTVKEFKLDADGRNGFREDRSRASLSQDGKLLLQATGDRWGNGEQKVRLWDTVAGKLLQQFPPREKGNIIHAACLAQDGKTVVIVEGPSEREAKGGGKEDSPAKHLIRFVDSASGLERRNVPFPGGNLRPGGNAFDLIFLADGKSLLIRGQNENPRLIDVMSGKELRAFAPAKGTARGMVLAADHKTLFVAGTAEISRYDVDTGKEAVSYPCPNHAGGGGGDFDPFGRIVGFSAAVTPDGKTLAVPDQLSVSFWDVPGGKEIPLAPGHRHRIDSVSFGPVGQILSAAADGKVLLWDAATATIMREFTPAPKSDKGDKEAMMMRRGGERIELYRAHALPSPDGKSVFGHWWGSKVHVWDLQTAKLKHLLGGTRNYCGYHFSPDGKLAALVAVDGTVELWDTATGRELRSFGTPPMGAVNPAEGLGGVEMSAFATAISPDRRLVISGGVLFESAGLKARIVYWELASGQERMRFETSVNLGRFGSISAIASALDQAVIGSAFSPDGKWVAETGFSNIRLRNLRTGEEVRCFGGKQIAAKTALFSPDGKLLIAGKFDGAVRIWDIATGSVIMDFPAHNAEITALAFSPDGRLLMTGCGDTSILVWDWQHIAAEAATRKTEPAGINTDKLWIDLAGNDAARAYAATKAFAAAPAQTLPFLKTRLRPTPSVEAKLLAKLIEDLDHPKYDTRQKAQAELDKLGDLAGDAIKERLTREPSAEMAARLTDLLKKLESQTMTPEILQAIRAVEILELIDTPEARAQIDALAKGAPGHRVTVEARNAQKRMK